MSTCTKCDLCFKGELIAVCHICNNLFHGTNACSGLSATEISVLKLKRKNPLLFYKCEECRKDGKENPIVNLLSDMRTRLDSLEKTKVDFLSFKETELPKLESDVMSLKGNAVQTHNQIKLLTEKLEELDSKMGNDFTSNNFSESTSLSQPSNKNYSISSNFKTFKEYNERQKRLNNLIIYNFPENVDSHGSSKSIVDSSKINELLSKFEIKTKITSKNIIRLGKYVKDKIRPIRLKMDNRGDVSKIISNWQALPKDLVVTFDLTVDQRSKYKILKNEVRQFNKDNKEASFYKVVRFHEGEPIILKKDKKNIQPSDRTEDSS